MSRAPELIRLEQLLSLVEKEDSHLQAVRDRLIPTGSRFNLEWLEATLADDLGADRLESFGSKFARMQDTVIDKLLQQLLKVAGETPQTAEPGWICAGCEYHAKAWTPEHSPRAVSLVHEYIESLEDMLPALKRAHAFTDELHNSYVAMSEYARNNLGARTRDAPPHPL
jgi:hypothetical protein